jgi:hypothetical protein
MTDTNYPRTDSAIPHAYESPLTRRPLRIVERFDRLVEVLEAGLFVRLLGFQL